MALHVRGHSRHAKTTLNERLETVLTCWERLAQRHPNLPTNEILTRSGQKNYDHLARECIKEAALEAEIRSNAFNEQFFSSNPSENPAWVTALNEQTPPPLPTDMSLLLIQGTADKIVLPQPNAY